MIPCYHLGSVCPETRLVVIFLLVLFGVNDSVYTQDLIYRTKNQIRHNSPLGPNFHAQTLSNAQEVFQIPVFGLSENIYSKSAYNDWVEESVGIEVNLSELKKIKDLSEDFLRIDIPVGLNQSFSVLLYESHLLSPDYSYESSHGSISNLDNDLPRFFHGIIEGDHNSIVSLYYRGDRLKMSIHDDSGGYELSKVRGSTNQYLFYSLSSLKDPKKLGCSTDDLQHNVDNRAKVDLDAKIDKSLGCIPIYIETDKHTFDQFNGDLGEVQDYVLGLVNEVSALYSNEGIDISLSQLRVTTVESDDWSASYNSVNTLLEGFAERIKDDYSGRLAHFITMRDLGGGIGWIDVLCNGYSTFWADWDNDDVDEEHHYGPYAVSSGMTGNTTPVSNYSYDVAVFTHEMGHNIGSFHTHACAWGPSNLAIDDCVGTEGGCGLLENPVDPAELGTIMSYCHLTSTGIDFTKGFGTLPGELLQAKVSSASCSLDCSDSELYGCTDPTYHNYNPNASIDDGSCLGHCADGIQNGDELGVDCGGSLCQPCSELCADNYIELTLHFDNHPEETHWEIRNASNAVVESGGTYNGEPDGSTLIVPMCLPDGEYSLIVMDIWGDGMCCSSGNGSYSLVDEQSTILASGGQFGSSESTNFSLSANNGCDNQVVVSGVPSNGSFSAAQNIMTSGEVMVTTSASFNSPSVNLYENFAIEQGASFDVSTSGCSN